jgi:hypothetical protein
MGEFYGVAIQLIPDKSKSCATGYNLYNNLNFKGYFFLLTGSESEKAV